MHKINFPEPVILKSNESVSIKWQTIYDQEGNIIKMQIISTQIDDKKPKIYGYDQ